MNEFEIVSLDHTITVMDAELMLVDQESVAGRFAFEKCDRSFNAKDASDQGAGQERYDTEMSN